MLSELNRFIAPSLQILESFSIVLLILVTFSSLADLSSEEKKKRGTMDLIFQFHPGSY